MARIRRIAAAAIASVAGLASLTGLTTAPASAAPTLEINYVGDSVPSYNFMEWSLCDTTIGNTYAKACWRADGDWIFINDLEKDGRRTAAHWRVLNSSGTVVRRGLCIYPHGTIWHPPGFERDGIGGWCNKDMPEGYTIQIRAGACDADVKNCELVDSYADWTAWNSART